MKNKVNRALVAKNRNLIFALSIVLAITFAACGNNSPKSVHDPLDTIAAISYADTVENNNEPRFWFDDAQENHKIIMQAIIDGDAEKLASVTEFPIYQAYPLKDINNAYELKQCFNILFDDSIKNVLRKVTMDNWSSAGWRGCVLLNGEYLWTTEEGLLHFVTYKSKAHKQYVQKMYLEEQQNLNENNNWLTHACFVALDSSVFLRLEAWDGVERLHVFTHSENQYEQHHVYNGSGEIEGACRNEYYRYACGDSVITVLVTSPMCLENALSDYQAIFPNHYDLPEALQGKTIPLQKAYWRDVKKWWR